MGAAASLVAGQAVMADAQAVTGNGALQSIGGAITDTIKGIGQDTSNTLTGLTKSLGEVKNNYTTTIRTSFIGPEKNKSKQLLNWFLKQNYKIKGYNNAFFSGLTSLELSNIIYYYFLKKNIFYNKILNIGGKKISKYKLLFLISKIFKKKIKIIKYSSFKIDRSLNSNKFLKISNYKVKSWIIMLKQLKKFMILNNFKF